MDNVEGNVLDIMFPGKKTLCVHVGVVVSMKDARKILC